MLEILRNQTFRQLFLAQVVALVGTGLATVALALLAFQLAGDQAGAVLGTALAIKMIAYILIGPVASAWIAPQYRKRALIILDLIRAAVACSLPFVTEIWQVYALIFLLQSASAGFTPLFQAAIPQVLPDERDYVRALSLSRLAYDLESLLSPALAAILLTVISFHGLFAGTALGFVGSALLVGISAYPIALANATAESPWSRLRRGFQIYFRTPRLRGLLALNLCAAAGGAMVFVNTVILVRTLLGGGEREVAFALSAFGAGSMTIAFALPHLLERISDRRLMLCAALMMATIMSFLAIVLQEPTRIGWPILLLTWFALGMCYAGLVTPGGRLLRRSAGAEHLPTLFAAQFSLSHGCWLLAYPLAGWIGASFGLGTAAAALAGLGILGSLMAWRVWPHPDAEMLPHAHPDLPPDHPHLSDHSGTNGEHVHAYHIDDLHRVWPRP
jgi:MFS family permease